MGHANDSRKPPDARPRSDVSVGVGLAGLIGLTSWVMLCRYWAAVADGLALPGPRLSPPRMV